MQKCSSHWILLWVSPTSRHVHTVSGRIDPQRTKWCGIGRIYCHRLHFIGTSQSDHDVWICRVTCPQLARGRWSMWTISSRFGDQVYLYGSTTTRGGSGRRSRRIHWCRGRRLYWKYFFFFFHNNSEIYCRCFYFGGSDYYVGLVLVYTLQFAATE